MEGERWKNNRGIGQRKTAASFGQSESIRLEFKTSSLLTKESEEKVKEKLSKEVSAFANSEGARS